MNGNLDEIITLDYGSGGMKTSRLIENLIVPAMDNEMLSELGDGAILDNPGGKLVFSTDSFVIDPIFFPGGDIGKLSVCGTVNDVSMCGGVPEFISSSLIIEEGLPTADLERIISSMSETAEKAGVKIVTGDTKVVERGRGDKIYINTAGIGFLRYPGLSRKAMRPGDRVIISGTAGDHGTAVMLARGGMLRGELRSDCCPLNNLAQRILECGGSSIRILRDPTRGGMATTLNEFIEGTSLGIELDEALIPVRPEVVSACDLLGLDPLYCANEGKLLAVVAPESAEAVVEAMRSLPEGKDACIIGEMTEARPGKLVMKTRFGGCRILQKLAGAQLPRIC